MRKSSLAAVNAVFAEVAKSTQLFMPVDGKDGRAEYKKW